MKKTENKNKKTNKLREIKKIILIKRKNTFIDLKCEGKNESNQC